jgi:hypothetical protein
VTAANAGNNVGLGTGDTLTIVFDQDTNRAGYASSTMSTSEVTGLLSIASGGSFGTAALSGSWTDDSTLVVTFGASVTGASITPKSTTVRILAAAALKSEDGSSLESTSGPFVVGGTLTSPPALVTVEASNTGGNIGAGSRDEIVFTFNQATNGGITVNKLDVAQSELLALFTLSGAGSFGTDYRGEWDATLTVLTVTIGTDTTGINLVPGTTTFTV